MVHVFLDEATTDSLHEMLINESGHNCKGDWRWAIADNLQHILYLFIHLFECKPK